MHFGATCAVALAVALSTACANTPVAPPPAAAVAPVLPAFAGVYGGSYTCVDGEHGFYLNITKATERPGGGYDVAGVLGIFPLVTAQGGPAGMVSGSFAVSGIVDTEGAIAMAPGDWLKQPADYGAANLEGALTKGDDGSYTLRGRPVVPRSPEACSSLLAAQFLP